MKSYPAWQNATNVTSATFGAQKKIPILVILADGYYIELINYEKKQHVYWIIPS